jgi:filamentous hemagglutinin family protein
MKTFAYNPFLRIAHKSLAYLLVFCIVNMPAWAIQNGDVVGTPTNATVSITDNVLTNVVLSDSSAIVDWSNLDTIAGEHLNYTYSGGSFAVLNRVAQQVNFNGNLNALGGHVFIVSPQGVIVGPDASITASAFTASGLNISNGDFLDGIYKFQPFEGGVVGDVQNYAVIDDVTEQVNLLGKTVLNEGTISLPEGGVVVMAAGDRMYLGEPGSEVLVEMSGIEEGMVANNGTVEASEGTIIMAAGDIYTTPLGLKVFNGAGRIVQNGTLDADAETYNGGTITMMAGEDITLTAGSVTTANAVPDGLGTVRPDGGDIIISSTERVEIDPQATLSARGNGWYDANQNFRFDFGIDTSFSGSIQISGQYLDLPSPGDYTLPTEFLEHFQLLGFNEGPLQQLQSGVLTVGNIEGDMTIAEGPLLDDPAGNTVYEEWIEDLSNIGVHIDTLSAGDITFEDLNLDDRADLGLIGGAGNMSFRTMFDTGGIAVSSFDDIIGTTDGGDIFMVAGSGGILTDGIGIINEDRTGDPGQILLFTANGGDIETGAMKVESGNREIVSVISSGDITINGGLLVSTNEVPDAIDKTATAEICFVAGDDIDITGPVEADAHGKLNVYTSIHMDAGVDPESNDEGESQAGVISIDLQNRQIAAISDESGPDKGNDLNSIARVQIHTEAVDEDGQKAISIINGKAGGSQAVQVRAKIQGKPDIGDSMPATDGTSYFQAESSPDGGVIKTQIALVEIQSNYDTSACDDCPMPPFLPPEPEFFTIKNDSAVVDWRSGYTIDGDSFTAADLNILLNDNGKDDQGNEIPLWEAEIVGVVIETLETQKGGTLEWTQFEYVDADGITRTYEGFVYTPPSYDVDFEWDGSSDYATFTDSFEYRAQIGDDISLNMATVTITVQNEVPTLAGDSDTIHMNTSADFDLSTLVTDNDGTPGDIVGTYGDLSYEIVEGQIPIIDGSIATDGTLTMPGDETIRYTPLDGYVSPEGAATTFGYSVTDDNITDALFELADGENLSVTVTNTAPTFDGDLGDVHMNTTVEGIDLLNPEWAVDPDGDTLYVIVDGQIATVSDFIEGNNVTAAELEYQGENSWTYTPADGYTGSESFTVTLWDGEYDYSSGTQGDMVLPENGSGALLVNMTNIKPTTDSDLGTVGTEPDPISQDGVISPVEVTDEFDNQQTVPDELSIPDGIYQGDQGGTLVFENDEWVYTPASGFEGSESFTINVWDGQNIYENGENVGPDYGNGIVRVTVSKTPPPSIPVAPLRDLEYPALSGCPAEMDAAASELGVNSDSLQIMFSNSMASNPNMQPCNACANLLTAATTLRQLENSPHVAALAQIFGTIAPIDAPYTPEISASITTVFADFRDADPQLALMSDEEYEEYQQYAMADELVEAFVSYVAVLENDLKMTPGDSIAMIIEKYFGAIEEAGNPNIGIYLIEQMEAVRVLTEPLIASAN